MKYRGRLNEEEKSYRIVRLKRTENAMRHEINLTCFDLGVKLVKITYLWIALGLHFFRSSLAQELDLNEKY